MSTRKNSIRDRKNAGEKLEVVRRDLGNGQSSMDILIGDAAVPDRRYTADVGTVLTSKGYARLIFGQTKICSTELRSMVDIHFPLDAVQRFLDVTPKLQEAFKAMSEANGAQVEPLADIKDEPGQTIGLSANAITSAITGLDGSMDYYHISASAMERAIKGGNLWADPVIRVNLPAGLLIAMVEKLKSI